MEVIAALESSTGAEHRRRASTVNGVTFVLRVTLRCCCLYIFPVADYGYSLWPIWSVVDMVNRSSTALAKTFTYAQMLIHVHGILSLRTLTVNVLLL